jgi:hypothetical protein
MKLLSFESCRSERRTPRVSALSVGQKLECASRAPSARKPSASKPRRRGRQADRVGRCRTENCQPWTRQVSHWQASLEDSAGKPISVGRSDYTTFLRAGVSHAAQGFACRRLPCRHRSACSCSDSDLPAIGRPACRLSRLACREAYLPTKFGLLEELLDLVPGFPARSVLNSRHAFEETEFLWPGGANPFSTCLHCFPGG